MSELRGVSVTAPPRPPRLDVPADPFEPEALIEEARRRARRRHQRLAGAALLVFAGLAVYVGIAYRGAHGVQAGSARPPTALRRVASNGPLTIFTGVGRDGIATVETVGHGRTNTLWSCPEDEWCGEPVSSAWAPDGKRLAVTLNEITLNDTYPFALHVINVVSGRDVEIPPTSSTGDQAFAALGCWPPTELAWSPDGKRLAYRCGLFTPGLPDDHINLLDLNAPNYRRTHLQVLPTHGPAFWPSWSPDGTRIAYSTKHGLTRNAQIYTINVNGSHRRLLATDGTAPAWSPDGSRIAYESSCGLRLVTPTGRDVTPGNAGRCRAIGPRGLPGWSPDGTKIAIETNRGIYVVNANGSELRLLTRKTSTILELDHSAHLERPSWQPRR
jgi:dipeptidyl aminopeptidase/acylaminoacyl peptidase